MFMYSVNNAVAVHACSHEFTRFIWIIWLMFNRTKSVLSWAAVQSACILHADVHVYTGWLKMQDVKMMDQKWRQGQGVKWNAKSIYSVYSASNVRRLCALLCPAISFLHFQVLQFHVLQFHALQIGPSISRPSFSAPPCIHAPFAYYLALYSWPIEVEVWWAFSGSIDETVESIHWDVV